MSLRIVFIGRVTSYVPPFIAQVTSYSLFYELRVTVYCTIYDLLFIYELQTAINCTSYELLFIYVSYELLFIERSILWWRITLWDHFWLSTWGWLSLIFMLLIFKATNAKTYFLHLIPLQNLRLDTRTKLVVTLELFSIFLHICAASFSIKARFDEVNNIFYLRYLGYLRKVMSPYTFF